MIRINAALIVLGLMITTSAQAQQPLGTSYVEHVAVTSPWLPSNLSLAAANGTVAAEYGSYRSYPANSPGGLALGGDNFATDFSQIHDVNGDGVPDYLVCQAADYPASYSFLFVHVAELHVISGLTGKRILNVQNYTPNGGHHYWGYQCAETIDVTGDGKPEILVSKPYFSSSPGSIEVRNLHSNPPGQLVTTIQPTGVTNDFGFEMKPVGDTDGDGIEDFAVADTDLGSAGKIVMIYPKANGTFSTGTITSPYTALGRSIAKVGDLNGDGLADFVALSGTGTQPLRLHVFQGTMSATPSLAQSIFIGGHNRVISPWYDDVIGLDDVNSDGVADFAISSAAHGTVWIYSGATRALLQTLSAAASDFGAALGVADTTGDGNLELIVGAPTESNNRGQLRIYTRGSGPTFWFDKSIDGLVGINPGGHRLSRAIAAGDIDHDGRDELLVAGFGNYERVIPSGASDATLGMLHLISVNPATVTSAAVAGPSNCRSTPMALTASAMVPGQSHQVQMTGLPTGTAFAVVMFSLAPLNQPVPTPIGTCNLMLDPGHGSTQIAYVAASSGTLTAPGFLPEWPILLGLKIRYQVFAFNLAGTLLGISDGYDLTPGSF